MQLRNVTRDTLNLNLRDGGSLILIGKKSKTIDCELDLLEEPEVKAAIDKGQVRIIEGERIRPRVTEIETKKKEKEKKKDKKRGRFAKKNDGTEG